MRRTKRVILAVGPAMVVVVITLAAMGCDRPASLTALDLGPTTDFLDPSLPDARPLSLLEGNCEDDTQCSVDEECLDFGALRGWCASRAPCMTDADCGASGFCSLPPFVCRPPGRCLPWASPPCVLEAPRVCDCAGRTWKNFCGAMGVGASVAWYGPCDASSLPCSDRLGRSIAADLFRAVVDARPCESDGDCWPVVELGDCCRVDISATAPPGALEHLRRARELFEQSCGCDAFDTSGFHLSCSPQGRCDGGYCR